MGKINMEKSYELIYNMTLNRKYGVIKWQMLSLGNKFYLF